jgi:rSAM/selenodomain-associated transferase 1
MRTVHRVLDPNRPADIDGGSCALAVMTKAPRAGEVKTRLVPPLTHDEAAQLNSSFLRDIAAAISAAIGETARGCSQHPVDGAAGSQVAIQRMASGLGVYTPRGTEAAYENILPKEFFLIAQRGHDFGDRLIFAAEDLFKVGFASVCLINSDSPTVPAENFSQAVELLQLPEDRIVLGPSDDGGYYLIGLKKLHREMFERINWSTERVLDQTLQRAAQIGAEVKLLPAGYDVDDWATLERLCSELLGENSSSHGRGIAPNTRKFLADIIKREGRGRIWPVGK